MIAKHIGTVKRGRFIPDNPVAFRFAFCKLEGQECAVTVQKNKKHRSSNQNRYYHGVVVKLVSEVTGYTLYEAHNALKMLFLRKHRDGMPETIGSTKDLNTKEFEEYLENVRHWAATDLCCFIPEPNQVEY